MADLVNVRRPTGGNQYQTPEMRLGRSQFQLNPQHKTSFDAGQLIPYFFMPVLPGDTVTAKLTSFLRVFSPLDAPIMDDIHVEIDYFYVPWRIVWENWEAFLGAHGDAGAQDFDYETPRLADGRTVLASDLASYFGIPIGLSTTTERVQSMPFRAYTFIYDEYYRDQNVIDSYSFPTDQGPDTVGSEVPS